MTRPLQDWVTIQAERRPTATALVMQETRLTYLEVEAASNRLAATLRKAGCEPGDRVCFLLAKSINAVLAIQGILKAGCLCVPIDMESPAPRLALIVEACRPRVILASAATIKRLAELRSLSPAAADARIGYLDMGVPGDVEIDVAFELDDVERESAEPGDRRSNGDGAAYLLFTSGSTGMPKGVVVTHANIDAFIGWARDYFAIGPQDRVSQHPPLHFDLSLFDMFGAFSAGAEVHLVPSGINLRADKMADFIRDNELTQWFSVPSMLSYMAKFDVVKPGDFPKLKRLLWCGEVLSTPTLIHYMKRLPHVQFTNLYGPTEGTIASSFHTVSACPKDADAAIPIGRPCAGEDLLVLDDALDPAAPDVIGDLYIRGVGLSPGYWEDPEKTAAAFLDSAEVMRRHGRIYKTGDLAKRAADGLIYFLGRADSQIKSRGYRIELGEIETALNAIDDLNECAVVAIDLGRFEGATICCAYEPIRGADVTPRGLRSTLAKRLPSYMLPTQWLALDSLPKNANGKIDRPCLREQARQQVLGAVGAA